MDTGADVSVISKALINLASSSLEDLAPGATPCSCRQSTTSATEGSDSKQSTEDEEQEEDESDNKQPGGHLGHGKEDSTES